MNVIFLHDSVVPNKMQQAFKEITPLAAILLGDIQGWQEMTGKQSQAHLAFHNYTMQPSCPVT